MATTTLKIEKDNVITKMSFMTVETEKGLDVDIYLLNEDNIPIGTPSLGVADVNEEDYHKKLRLEALSRNQFDPEFSTNPEWNPNYNPEQND